MTKYEGRMGIVTAGLVVAGALGLASYWALRLAHADCLARRDTPEALPRAVKAAPGNAEYHAWRAALLEQAGEDAGAVAALEAAVALNPRYWSAWIELGLRGRRGPRTWRKRSGACWQRRG
jgi:hypothetical protein